jgi:hypothetical protein
VLLRKTDVHKSIRRSRHVFHPMECCSKHSPLCKSSTLCVRCARADPCERRRGGCTGLADSLPPSVIALECCPQGHFRLTLLSSAQRYFNAARFGRDRDRMVQPKQLHGLIHTVQVRKLKEESQQVMHLPRQTLASMSPKRLFSAKTSLPRPPATDPE